jgi:hypothetical protein
MPTSCLSCNVISKQLVWCLAQFWCTNPRQFDGVVFFLLKYHHITTPSNLSKKRILVLCPKTWHIANFLSIYFVVLQKNHRDNVRSEATTAQRTLGVSIPQLIQRSFASLKMTNFGGCSFINLVMLNEVTLAPARFAKQIACSCSAGEHPPINSAILPRKSRGWYRFR